MHHTVCTVHTWSTIYTLPPAPHPLQGRGDSWAAWKECVWAAPHAFSVACVSPSHTHKYIHARTPPGTYAHTAWQQVWSCGGGRRRLKLVLLGSGPLASPPAVPLVAVWSPGWCWGSCAGAPSPRINGVALTTLAVFLQTCRMKLLAVGIKTVDYLSDAKSYFVAPESYEGQPVEKQTISAPCRYYRYWFIRRNFNSS